jgi:hypothetical protein
VAWCAGLGIGVFVVGHALEAGPLGDFPQIMNPYGVDSPVVRVVGVASALVLGGSMVASALSMIVRARSAGRAERQQIKWLAYGGVVVVVTIFVGGVISIWSVSTSIGIISLALLGLPVFTGVAILKYRLYEIDLIINRTLVYGALTAFLALVYFGGVALLQGIGTVILQVPFRILTGEKSTLAVVASTLVIAALFNPLRRRMQALVDRRFYRRKYDAAKTLEAFGSRLRDQTNLDALSNDVVRVAETTVQPAHVSLWLRPDPEPEARSAALRQFGRDE